MEALGKLGIEKEHIKLVANIIFSQDDDDEDRELDCDDFLEELMRIKPQSEAHALEAMGFNKEVKKQASKLQVQVEELFTDVQAKFSDIQAKEVCTAEGIPLPFNG